MHPIYPLGAQMFDNHIGDWKFINMVLLDDHASDEAKEVVSVLEVSRWPKADSWTTKSLHIISGSIIFVGFAVGTERSPTVMVII